MEHVVTIDNGAPLAFDRTPLSIAREGMRGPRTPFSPKRIVVPLPDTNPEEEESLAGALKRQGATIIITIITSCAVGRHNAAAPCKLTFDLHLENGI